MEKTKAILAGLLAGLAAPASIVQHTHYQRLHGSDLSRMRGDVVRVGADFNSVIARSAKASGLSPRNRPLRQDSI